MENENIQEEQTQPTKEQPKISTPVAIIIAGLMIFGGIMLTKGGSGGEAVAKNKSLSEQVGVSKDALTKCIQEIDQDALGKYIKESADKSTASTHGTPYTVVVGKDGLMAEISGALPYEEVMKTIQSVSAGKVEVAYKSDIVITEPGDHVYGNPDAPIKVIEYSDFECPYCARFQPILKQIVDESKGNISWTFRNLPVHGTITKLVAAECVAKIKGNDAYWKYADLLFALIAPEEAPVVDDNL